MINNQQVMFLFIILRKSTDCYDKYSTLIKSVFYRFPMGFRIHMQTYKNRQYCYYANSFSQWLLLFGDSFHATNQRYLATEMCEKQTLSVDAFKQRRKVWQHFLGSCLLAHSYPYIFH